MRSSHQESWQARPENRGQARLQRDLRRAAIVSSLLLLAAVFVYFLFPPFFAPQTYLVLVGSQNDDAFNVPPIAFVGEDLVGMLSVDETKVSDHRSAWNAAYNAKQLAKNLESTGLTSADNLIIYLAAHGVSDDGKAYLLCDNFDLRRPDWGRISVEVLIDQVSKSPAATKLILLNAGTIDYDPRMGMVANEFPRLLAKAVQQSGDPSLWVLCSHSSLEYSHVSRGARRSVFGMFVEQGLKGAADLNRDQKIDLSELVGFTSANVSRWVTQSTDRGADQTPKLIWGGGVSPKSNPRLLTLYRDVPQQKMSARTFIKSDSDSISVASDESQHGQSQGLLRRHQITLASNPRLMPGAKEDSADTLAGTGGPDAATADAGTDGVKSDGTEGDVADAASDQPAGGETADAGPSNTAPAGILDRSRKLLAHAWRLRDESAGDWSAVNPSLSTIENWPHLWRELQAELLAFEQLSRSGIAFDSGKVESLLTDSFPAKQTADPAAAPATDSVIASLFKKSSTEVLPKGSIIELNEIHSLALAKLVAQSEGHSLSIDTHSLYAELEKNSPKGIDEWLKKNWRREYSNYYELAYLRRLLELPDLRWDLLQLASRTCFAGERVAALDLLSTDWVRSEVQRADQLRFFAEQLIIDQIGEDWEPRCDALFREASEIYADAESKFDEVRRAQFLMEVLLANTPSYLRWHRMAGSLPGGGATNFSELSSLLDQMRELAESLGQPNTTNSDELASMRESLAALQSRIETTCGDLSATKLLGHSPTPGDSYHAGLLLKTPLLRSSVRSDLVSAIDGLDRQLAINYQLPKVSSRDATASHLDPSVSSPSQQVWNRLFQQAQLESKFVELSRVGEQNAGRGSVSMSRQGVRAAFDSLRSVHQTIISTLDSGRDLSAESDREIDLLWSSHAKFGAALQVFYRSASGATPSSTSCRSLSSSRETVRMLRMLDPRDVWEFVQEDVTTIMLAARIKSTLVWQAKRLDHASVFRSGQRSASLARLASAYRLESSLMCGQQEPSIDTTRISVNVPPVIDLQYGLAEEFLIELHNQGDRDLAVSLSLDYEHDWIDVNFLDSTNGADPSIVGHSSELEFQSTPTEFGTQRSDVITIGAGQKRQIPIEVTRRGIASERTKLVVDVLVHSDSSTSDKSRTPNTSILLGRRTLDVMLPVGEVYVRHGPRSFVSGTDGLKLLPHPNRLESFLFGVVNHSSREKRITMTCYSLSDLSSADMPADLSKLLAGATPIATFNVIAPGDGQPSFPVTEDAEGAEPKKDDAKEAGAKEEETEPKPIESTEMPHGMMVVLTDLDTGQSTYRRINFAVQRPRRFVVPRVGFDANKNRITIDVQARDLALVPDGDPVRIVCSLAGGDPVGTRGKLEGEITKDNLTASLFITMSTPPPFLAQVHLEVDGYPRAFIFDVPCGKQATNLPELTDLFDLQMTTASKNGVLASTESIPVALQVDTPVGSFEDGHDTLVIGIDPEGKGVPNPETSIRLTADRSVRIGFVKSHPDGTVDLNTVVSDFMIDLPVDRLENLDFGVAANLTVNNQSQAFPSIPLLIDTAAPIVGPVNQTQSVGFVNVGGPIELSVWAWDTGSGVTKVEAAFDQDGSGEFPEAGELFSAVQISSREWALTANAGADIGKKTLLVRGVDGVGNASEPVAIDVEVVSLKEGAERVKQQTVDLIGTIQHREKVVSEAEVKLIAIPEDPTQEPDLVAAIAVRSMENGRYSIPGVAPGSYRLAARRVIRNKVHRVEKDIVVAPGPKRSMRIDVTLP